MRQQSVNATEVFLGLELCVLRVASFYCLGPDRRLDGWIRMRNLTSFTTSFRLPEAQPMQTGLILPWHATLLVEDGSYVYIVDDILLGAPSFDDMLAFIGSSHNRTP